MTLAVPSMRPAGLEAPFPGSVSRVENATDCALPSRDKLNAMPVAVTHFTKVHRESCIFHPMVWHVVTCRAESRRLKRNVFWLVKLVGSYTGWIYLRSASVAGPGPGVIRVGHWCEPNGTTGGSEASIPSFAVSAMIAARPLPPINS